MNPGRALSAVDAKALMRAAQPLRLGAAVTLLFCQGWRVSEVLGLAWEDIDFREGAARIQRGAAYTPSQGTVLGRTKTSGAEGVHFLAPASVEHLRRRREQQSEERVKCPTEWPVHRRGRGPVDGIHDR
ncbi:MAG: tyrosine-type recombinase/integrase [Ilumatobacteraceae bacterium]